MAIAARPRSPTVRAPPARDVAIGPSSTESSANYRPRHAARATYRRQREGSALQGAPDATVAAAPWSPRARERARRPRPPGADGGRRALGAHARATLAAARRRRGGGQRV